MTPHAWVRETVTWGGALLISVYLLWASLAQSGSVSWGPLLAVVGIVLLLGWCSRRVVDGMWSRRQLESEQRTVDIARRVGIRAAAVFTVGFGALVLYQAPAHLKVRAFVLFASLMLCFGFALWLCAGYLFATIMGKLHAKGRTRGKGS